MILKRYLLLLMLSVTGFNTLFSQTTFQYTFQQGNGLKAVCINTAVGGGYLLACNYTDNTGEKSILFYRLDSQFNILWVKILGQPAKAEKVNSFMQDGSGNIYIAGYIEDSVKKSLVVKTDSSLNITWSRLLNYSLYNSMATQIYRAVSGELTVLGNSEDDYLALTVPMTLVIKLSAGGNVMSQHTFTNSFHDNSHFKMLPYAGNMIAAGNTSGVATPFGLLTKFDLNGNFIWGRTFPLGLFSNYLGYANGFTYSPSGGFLVYSLDMDSTGTYNRNAVLKFDTTGNMLGKTYYEFQNIPYMNLLHAIPTYDGGYLMLGYMWKLMLLKLNSNLVPQWCHQYSTFSYNYDAFVFQAADSGFVITSSPQNGNQVTLLKTDAQGNSLCEDSLVNVSYSSPSLFGTTQYGLAQTPALTPVSYTPAISNLSVPVPDTSCSHLITSATAGFSFPRLEIFPNPVHDELFIETEIASANASYVIYDLSGKIIAENQYSFSGRRINISSLTKGFYFLKINDGKNILYTRFVKE